MPFTFGSFSIADSEIFYIGDLVYAMVNYKPVTPGHVLVCTKRAVPRYYDLNSEEAAEVAHVSQLVGKVVEDQFQGQGLTYAIQDGPNAGQTVPHLHMHIMPRSPGDFARNDDVYEKMEGKGLDADRPARSAAVMAEEALLLRGCGPEGMMLIDLHVMLHETLWVLEHDGSLFMMAVQGGTLGCVYLGPAVVQLPVAIAYSLVTAGTFTDPEGESSTYLGSYLSDSFESGSMARAASLQSMSTMNSWSHVDFRPMVGKWRRCFRNQELENKYLRLTFRRSKGQLRSAHIIGGILFAVIAAFLVLMNTDTITPDEVHIVLLELLVGFCLPVFVAAGFTWHEQYIRFAEAINVFLCVLGSLMITLATVVKGNSADLIAVPSIVLLISVMTPFLKIRYFASSLASLLIVVLYTAITFGTQSYTVLNQAILSMLILLGFAVVCSASAAHSEMNSRMNFMVDQNMKAENERLRKKILRLRKQFRPTHKKVDFDAPIMKVVSILRIIKEKRELDDDDVENLETVTRILSNTNVWAPNFSKQLNEGTLEMDQETKKWLFYEVASNEKKQQHDADIGTRILEQQKPTDPQTGVYVPDIVVSSAKILPVLSAEDENSLNSLLEDITDWSKFNIFEVDRLTGGRPLYFVALYLFQKHDLLSKFDIDGRKFKNFLAKIENGYHDNPYHNRIHAADVLQSSNYILTKGGLAGYLKDYEVLGVLLSAIVHDYDHPGHNNNYEIAVDSELAITYNDRSVLENHHCASCFRMAAMEESGIFSNFTREDKKLVRQVIVECVLATDMSLHFEILGQFKNRLSDETCTFSELSDRLLLMKVLIKCADIGHVSKPVTLHDKWTWRLTEEFFNQGDKERDRGLPVSPFMDKTTPNIPKSQLGFIDFVVLPLFNPWSEFLQHDVLVNSIMDNRAYWDSKMEKEEPQDEPAAGGQEDGEKPDDEKDKE